MRTTKAPESPAQRQERLRQLVIELDSYAAAARQLGLSPQRVHALAGPGLTSQCRSRSETHCGNCRAALTGRSRSKGLCRRCATWEQKHGHPWSPEAAEALRHRLHTHCKRGHELTEANLYITGGKRQCRICARERSARWRQTAVGKRVVAANNRRQQERRTRGEHSQATPARAARIAQLQALVRELDSYAAAATQLGCSPVHLPVSSGPSPASRAPRPSPKGITREELRALVLHECSYRKAATIAGLSVAELKALVGADLLVGAQTAKE